MLGQLVKVIIDKNIETLYPQHNTLFYEVTYGYITNENGEKLNAYVLDVKDINEYRGRVIAIIHNLNEKDIYIVANKRYSKEEISKLVNLKEQSFIEMYETTKEDIIYDLTNAGILNTDTLLIHSSVKSFGKVLGEIDSIIESFKTVCNNGLIIFPTHTWQYIKEDNQVFDVLNTKSCVGALGDVARTKEGFKRSLHPTHSVCAYGKNKEEYLNLDNKATTPVSYNGCFGVLGKMNAKILFLGCPLSKNTFIHSIEEKMNVEDRLTTKEYIFNTLDYSNNLVTFNMKRHYSTKSDHISLHYEKLLPRLLEHNIANICYIGNSKTVIVDARKCEEYVTSLLNKDIHIFDDFKEIKD